MKDLSNRQGLEEDQYYKLFVDILITGIANFERYRQTIIRNIVKNEQEAPQNNRQKSVVNSFLSDPTAFNSDEEKMLLANEIESILFERTKYKEEKSESEERYKYDIRILNVLSTAGLKATAKAHELRNDRNLIEDSVTSIVEALKEYGYWDELNSREHTKLKYKNVPLLLSESKRVSSKLVGFMDAMLSESEKSNFIPGIKDIEFLIRNVCSVWEREYGKIHIEIAVEESLEYHTSSDIIKVILDNLIMNSIQQNKNSNDLRIKISATRDGNMLKLTYEDNGVGLAKKYKNDPWRILEVHETTREDGHGLGMWIVNNTVSFTGGSITNISLPPGFSIELVLGEIQ